MRRSLARRTGRIAPLARYVAARRVLATDVHAFTPTRFLHHLGLIAAGAPWDDRATAWHPQPPAVRLPDSEPEPLDLQPLEPGPLEHARDATRPVAESGDTPRPVRSVTAPLALPPVEAPAPVARRAARPSPAPSTAVPAPIVLPSRATVHAPPAATVAGATPSAAGLEPASDTPPPVATLEIQEPSLPHSATHTQAVVAEAPVTETAITEAATTEAADVAMSPALRGSLSTLPAAPRVETPAASAPAPAVAPAPAPTPTPIATPAPVLASDDASPIAASAPADRDGVRARHSDQSDQDVLRSDGGSPARPHQPAAPPVASEAPSVASPFVSAGQREVTTDTAVALDAADAPAPPPVSEPRATPPLPRRRASVQELPRVEGRPAPRPRYVDEGPRASHRPPQRSYGTPAGDDTSQSDALLAFGPGDDSDRSPLAWAARLADSLRDPSAPAPRPSPVTPAPRGDGADAPLRAAPLVAAPRAAAPPAAAPTDRGREVATAPARSAQVVRVSPEARRFLRPLVGVDAAEATFVAGPAAEAVTGARHADAVTAGTVVALGADYTGDATPEGLGLLAHELTHVARRASPRFVPPIARSMPGHAPLRVTGVTGVTDEADEESVALRVEGRVRAAATVAPAQAVADMAPSAVESPLGVEALATGAVSAPIAGLDDAVAARPAPARPSKWSGLPAPWEPMPDLTSPAPALPASVASTAPGIVAPLTPPAPPSAAPWLPASSTAATPPVADVVSATFDGSAHAEAIHAAEHDRAPEAPAPASANAERGEQKPPDLDRLARQVYSVLKRRLRADAAREWA